MTEQEILYFKELEEKSKNSPMVRIQAASLFIGEHILRSFSLDKNKQGELWCYMLTALSGIAAAVAAEENEMVIDLNSMFFTPPQKRIKLETEAGIFWMGEPIDRYVYNGPLSVWNIVRTLYSQKCNGRIPDLETAISRNAKIIGSPKARVWAGKNNPYNEIEGIRRTYDNLRNILAPYKLKSSEFPSVFAMALGNAVVEVEKQFHNQDNCLEMILDTVLFYSHM